MLSVTAAHAGDLASVGFLLWSPEAAAAAPEQRLRYLQRGGGFAEGEEPSGGSGWGSSLGASRWAAGLVQVQLYFKSLWTKPFGPHVFTVCFFTYFHGLGSL